MVPIFFTSSVYLTIIKRKGHANGRLKIFEEARTTSACTILLSEV